MAVFLIELCLIFYLIPYSDSIFGSVAEIENRRVVAVVNVPLWLEKADKIMELQKDLVESMLIQLQFTNLRTPIRIKSDIRSNVYLACKNQTIDNTDYLLGNGWQNFEDTITYHNEKEGKNSILHIWVKTMEPQDELQVLPSSIESKFAIFMARKQGSFVLRHIPILKKISLKLYCMI